MKKISSLYGVVILLVVAVLLLLLMHAPESGAQAPGGTCGFHGYRLGCVHQRYRVQWMLH